MFTGIIEATGEIVSIKKEAGNVHFVLNAPFVQELKIDQSVAHNGACLTIVALENDTYTVTAIEETLHRTNLGQWALGDLINLERCLQIGDRLDGHMVQGHVDTTALCTLFEEHNGSWVFGFEYHSKEHLTVSKGSITINGVSLTVVDSTLNYFSVAIIPFTFAHTNFSRLKKGDAVNLEFDIIGKYVARYLAASETIKN